MASYTLYLLAVSSLIIWSSSSGLHIEPSEPRETFVDIVGPSIRPPSDTGHIIPRDGKDSEVKDVVQTLELLPNDTGHIIPKDHQEGEEQLQNRTPTSTTPSTSNSTTITRTKTGRSQCYCGKVNRGSRIVGGKPTEVNEYPWHVGMVNGTKPYCAASIITNLWVLTAAHCVISIYPGYINLVVGEHNYEQTGETDATERRTVSQVIIHPDYDYHTVNNDIALLKLSAPLEFKSDNKVSPVCPPDPTANYDNVDAIVIGWGRLSSGGSQPSVLHEVTVPTMTNAACGNAYMDSSLITDNMICAGLRNGGKSGCKGDSGGAMVTPDSKNNMVQIGIVSWGYECGALNYPGVNTRVTRYTRWINSYIVGSQLCPTATS